MKRLKKKLNYSKPKITKEKLSINNFFDSRYVDSLPSLFDSTQVLAQSSCGGGGCSTNSHGCVCLLPETLITLSNKTNIMIKDVKKGMTLFDGTRSGAIVEACYPHIRNDGYIEINSGLIQSSKDHEFWVENKQKWLRADECHIGDVLVAIDNKKIVVNSFKYISSPQVFYNVELEFSKQFYYANGIKTHVMKLLPSENRLYL